MSKFTKTAAAVLALSSSAVFAGTMGPVCAPGPVTVPCENTAWDFGGRALYLRPAGSDFTSYTVVTSGNNTNINFNDSNFKWGWGFEIEGSYHFSTGNDINVNWYHYEKTTDFNRFGLVVPDDIFFDFSSVDLLSQVKPRWDAVNFEFGQRVNFGEHKVIRFHGGAQWANIRRNVNAALRETPNPRTLATPFPFGLSSQTKFNGFGPRVGLDMAYHFGNGLAIYANGATALLVGNTKFNVTVSNATNVPTTFINAYGKKNSISPELEGKLGAMYTYGMGNGDLTLDVGYMVVDYLNGLSLANNNINDFNLQGLYFGAKWVGNVI